MGSRVSSCSPRRASSRKLRASAGATKPSAARRSSRSPATSPSSISSDLSTSYNPPPLFDVLRAERAALLQDRTQQVVMISIEREQRGPDHVPMHRIARQQAKLLPFVEQRRVQRAF